MLTTSNPESITCILRKNKINSKLRNEKKAISKAIGKSSTNQPRGRRGPGILRPTTGLENSVCVDKSISQPNSVNPRLGHFKPSLTPGLGTRRIIYPSSRQDADLRFSMEPKPSDEGFQQWLNAMRHMARLGDGLPPAMRSRVWFSLANRQLAKQHVDWDHVIRMAFNHPSNPDDERLGTQIVKDLHRTGCVQFGSDEDKAALKRVLLAYARWNKRVGYCQGFNVIAAGVLDVTGRDEEKAFKILVYLIDYILPESYFAQNLQALSVDIAVFRHLLQERLPQLASHLDRLQCQAAAETDIFLGIRSPNSADPPSEKPHGSSYEPPLMNVYVIQWFLTLFATCLSPDAVLRIWDSILLEGSEIILRTAIVIMDFLASRLMKLKSADQFYGTMSDLMTAFAEGRVVSTQELLFEIYELAPFPYPGLKELRETFMYNIAPLSSINQTQSHMKLNCSELKKSKGFAIFNLINSGRKKNDNLTNRSAHIQETKKLKSLLKMKPNDGVCSEDNVPANSKAQVIQNSIKESELAIPSSKLNQVGVLKTVDSEQNEDEYQEINLNPDIDQASSNTGKQSQNQAYKINSKNLPVKRSKSQLKLGTIELEPSSPTKCFQALYLQFRNASTNDFQKDNDTLSLASYGPDRCMGSALKKFSVFQSLRSSPVRRTDRSPSRTDLDISELGPGAVGDFSKLRPENRTSSADQARMSTNLHELKTIYHNQQTRQRSTILLMPNLLDSNKNDGFINNNLVMETVLPQKNINHINLKSQIPDQLDSSQTTFAVPLNNQAESESPSSRVQNHSNSGSSDRNDKSVVNPEILGAVRSWQQGAIWTSRPCTHTDELPETVDPSSEINNKPKFRLWELAARAPSTSCYTDSISKQFSSTRSLECRCSSECCDICLHLSTNNPEVTSSLVRNFKFQSRASISDDFLVDMLRRTNERQRLENLASKISNPSSTSTGRLVVKDESSVCTDVETISSSHSSVSNSTLLKKPPWQQAAACFPTKTFSNSTHKFHTNPKSCYINSLSLPIPKSRQQFGAQFGIYKNIQHSNVNAGSQFADRIRLVQSVRISSTHP